MADLCWCGHRADSHRATGMCLNYECECAKFVAASASVSSPETAPCICGHARNVHDDRRGCEPPVCCCDEYRAAAPASLGERPRPAISHTNVELDAMLDDATKAHESWRLWFYAYDNTKAVYSAADMAPRLAANIESLVSELRFARAEVASLSSSLIEARADSERWRYLRQFLCVDRWEMSPASSLGAYMFKVPPIVGRSNATVEEIVDAARSSGATTRAEDATPE